MSDTHAGSGKGGSHVDANIAAQGANGISGWRLGGERSEGRCEWWAVVVVESNGQALGVSKTFVYETGLCRRSAGTGGGNWVRDGLSPVLDRDLEQVGEDPTNDA